jgi:hypothetical protein
MARVRGSYGVRLASALLLLASQSPAEPGGATERGSRERAVITLIAAAAESTELRRVLNELLARDEIEVRFATRPSFGSAELLRASSSDDAVEAFVVPAAAGRARLYFRAPDGQRFLVRDVALPSGFDAVGRELIAQIVESSIATLLHSAVGISRAQLKAQVESSAAAPRASAAAPTVEPSAPAKPALAAKSTPAVKSAASTARRRAEPAAYAVEGWLAARYAADWSGSALGMRHGPGLELGVGVRRLSFVRARLVVEQDFPVTLQAGPVDAKETTARWRALIDWGTAVGPGQALALSVGAGKDSSRIEPTASRDALVVPAGASRQTPLVLHSEARLEASVAPFRLTLAVGFDIPLVQTPYDVDRGAAAKELAAPWAVWPGATLSAAWCPWLGSF